MKYAVLDTCIVSYLMRADARIEPYRAALAERTWAVSFATIGELFEGAFRASWGARRLAELERELRKYLVIPYSGGVARHWGEIRAERKRRPISENDAWIAATARAHRCPLITDDRGFQGISGLTVDFGA